MKQWCHGKSSFNHTTTCPKAFRGVFYNSAKPGIGNWLAKASTSVLISATRCWNFSPCFNAWMNSFRGALGSRLPCTSRVSMIPTEKGQIIRGGSSHFQDVSATAGQSTYIFVDYLCEWTLRLSWSHPAPSLWRSALVNQTSNRWDAKHFYLL